MNKKSIEKAIQGLERVNLDEGGLFIVRLEVEVPVEILKKITGAINTVLNRHCEGAEVLVLPRSIGQVGIINAESMEKLGWVKREENDE